MESSKATITREALAKTVARSLHLKGTDSYKYIDKIIEIITCSLLEEKIIRIRLFGSFNIRHKRARIGRNPRTKVEAIIHPRKVIQFKVAPTFKKKINNNVLAVKDNE